jgi:RNA 2',3'-cyclic 3'-phosphodiesterase
MSERWRCFVAVPIGDGLRGRLAAAAETWRAHPDAAGLRWSDPASWHLTLAFLGLVPAADVGRITGAIERVAGGPAPMRLATGGLGAFPSPRRARVLWYGVADPERRLAALADALAAALDLQAADPFRPHLTLARAGGRSVSVIDLVAHADAPRGRIDIDRIDLMRSHLGGGPARYERLASVRLEVATHV